MCRPVRGRTARRNTATALRRLCPGQVESSIGHRDLRRRDLLAIVPPSWSGAGERRCPPALLLCLHTPGDDGDPRAILPACLAYTFSTTPPPSRRLAWTLTGFRTARSSAATRAVRPPLGRARAAACKSDRRRGDRRRSHLDGRRRARGPLDQRVAQRLPDLARLPIIDQASGEFVDQAAARLRRSEQHGASIGARARVVEHNGEGSVAEIGKGGQSVVSSVLKQNLRCGKSDMASVLSDAEAFVSLPKSAPS